jgi:epoxyqueuosine reductase
MTSLPATDWVVAEAKALGFDLCGITRAAGWDELSRQREWLERGYAGEMGYLHDPRRADLSSALPEVKSIIVCAVNYNSDSAYSTEAATSTAAGGQARAWISRYAWGHDYHRAIGRRLDALAASLRIRFGDAIATRTYVDTGPIPERIAARHAGLGWLGKNTCLINEQIGSWLFLGVVLTSIDFSPSELNLTPPADLCGHCTLCLDACPTGALVEPYVLDARRCISYLTIELRGSIPDEFRGAMRSNVFGCDICQDVCPWNRRAPSTTAPEFAPRENLNAPELVWLLSLQPEDFQEVFRGSPVRRAKWRGLIRNACVAAGNVLAKSGALDPSNAERLQGRLMELAASDDVLVAEHARWALAQLAASPIERRRAAGGGG